MNSTIHIIPGNSMNKLLLEIVKDGEKEAISVVSLFGPDEKIKPFLHKNSIPHRSLDFQQLSIFQRLQSIRSLLIATTPSVIYLHSYQVYKWFSFFAPTIRKHHLVPVRHHHKIHYLEHRNLAILHEILLGQIFRNWVAVSQQLKKTMSREGILGRRIRVIPNALDIQTKLRPTKVDKTPLRMISIGRFCYQKNIKTQVEIVRSLVDKGVDVKLDIFGTGPVAEVSTITEFIREMGVGAHVSLMGHDDEVSELLGNYSLFLHTAIDEACPLVILEALLVGVPVVSSNCLGCFEILSGFYEMHDPSDVESYVKNILQLTNDDYLMIKRPQEIASLVREKYSVHSMRKSYRNLAQELN